MGQKIETALRVLGQGGRFKKALERGYFQNQMVYKVRLYNAAGARVAGIGYAVLEQLIQEGKVRQTEFMGGGGVWKLNPEAMAQGPGRVRVVVGLEGSERFEIVPA